MRKNKEFFPNYHQQMNKAPRKRMRIHLNRLITTELENNLSLIINYAGGVPNENHFERNTDIDTDTTLRMDGYINNGTRASSVPRV